MQLCEHNNINARHHENTVNRNLPGVGPSTHSSCMNRSSNYTNDIVHVLYMPRTCSKSSVATQIQQFWTMYSTGQTTARKRKPSSLPFTTYRGPRVFKATVSALWLPTLTSLDEIRVGQDRSDTCLTQQSSDEVVVTFIKSATGHPRYAFCGGSITGISLSWDVSHMPGFGCPDERCCFVVRIHITTCAQMQRRG